MTAVIEPFFFHCREEYVLRVRYDELKAKYEHLVLQSGGGISQSDLIDRRPRGVGQRHSTVEASPSVNPPDFVIGGSPDALCLMSPLQPVVHNNIDAHGIHITEVGRDVHYHLLTIRFLRPLLSFLSVMLIQITIAATET
jgi:hypothetical protein